MLSASPPAGPRNKQALTPRRRGNGELRYADNKLVGDINKQLARVHLSRAQPPALAADGARTGRRRVQNSLIDEVGCHGGLIVVLLSVCLFRRTAE
ncbi:hypothetical protein EVAR_98114_1 [Eumeta japonica]|uniref:Uncharacterized protein n=1 Tax=Eumeta variegata TaxID=151549 RepID=A0A4C2A9C7_EUMVA|nr:hypothetical protein EVAR_98114_1 [Eumeta japonica]